MKKNILDLTKKLITIESVYNNDAAIEQCLNLVIKLLQKYTIETFEKDGTRSLLIYNRSKRPKKFRLILNAHVDITPAKPYQYTPRVKNGKLYGAGAMDMKAALATIVFVYEQIADKVSYPLGLQIVTDEEPGGVDGTKYQIEKGVCADFVIAGESTNLNIVNKTKGAIWMKVFVNGKSAHSAYPWKGENAILKMNKFLQKLEAMFPLPKREKWVTTFNVSRIETTNQTFNKIPDICSAWLDIRYIPEEKDIITTISALFPKGFRMEIVENEPPMDIDANNYYIQQLKKVTQEITNKKVLLYGAHGTSDARHFNQINCNGIEFGPVGAGLGSSNEWISISSLEKYAKILKTFLLELNQNNNEK